MGIIAWIIFGGLAGWVASMIMKTDAEQGVLANILVGVVGAVVGGWIASFFVEGEAGVTGFNLTSFGIALLGAVVVLWVYKALRKA